MTTQTQTEIVHLDGAQGEGGGQILRSALTLSMITGKPFQLKNIRAGRKKPGLLRQHLTAVQAAAAVCAAEVEDAAPGSQTLRFTPGAIRGGDYSFAIGSAGSCTLVLQTVLPALWFATTPACIRVSGGTHNAMAPAADFLIHAWLPLMRRMGVQTEIELLRHGFYPAGGGEIVATTQPGSVLRSLQLETRGEVLALKAEAVVAGVPFAVAQRELDYLSARFAHLETRSIERPSREGPGNALMLTLRCAELTEVFVAFGEKGRASERVAEDVVQQAQAYLRYDVSVGEYLADQLLLPMALAGGGSLTVASASSHLRTNLAVIERFLPVESGIDELPGGGVRVWLR